MVAQLRNSAFKTLEPFRPGSPFSEVSQVASAAHRYHGNNISSKSWSWLYSSQSPPALESVAQKIEQLALDVRQVRLLLRRAD
jgi:hypothetical protein